MPNIIFSHTFSDANPATGTQIMENVYTPNGSTSLDRANLRSGERFSHVALQPHAVSRAWGVGSRQTLDYLAEVFEPDSTKSGCYTPIPGACCRFYMRRETFALLLGYCVVGADADWPTGQAVEIRMFYDDMPVLGTMRDVPQSVFAGVREPGMDRVYTFQRFCTLSRGWHEAGLGVYSQANLVRFRSRCFVAIELY